MLYSENAKIINMRLTISVTDMKALVRQNHYGTNLRNGFSLFSRKYKVKRGTLGSAMTLLQEYLKIGVGVYRTTLAQLSSGILVGLTDQGKT